MPTPACDTTPCPSALMANLDRAALLFTWKVPSRSESVDRLLAKQGIDPRVVDLANKIKAAQGPEIQQMQSRLRLALPIGFRKDV